MRIDPKHPAVVVHQHQRVGGAFEQLLERGLFQGEGGREFALFVDEAVEEEHEEERQCAHRQVSEFIHRERATSAKGRDIDEQGGGERHHQQEAKQQAHPPVPLSPPQNQ